MLRNRTTFFLFLWVGSLLATLAIFPYQLAMIPQDQLPLSPLILGLLAVIQTALMYGLIIWLGISLARKIDFPILWFSHNVNLKNQLFVPGLIGGLIAAVIVLSLNSSCVNGVCIPFAQYASLWHSLAAALYGAFQEEIIARLFLVSLLVWLGNLLVPSLGSKTIAWAGIVLSALVFGFGHLPILYTLYGQSVSLLMVLRVIALNSGAGIIFGWLYWKKGFETAMLAHFVADIARHSALPIIG
jgi:membrane protease YdiL (CAAX protease family)